MNNWCIVNRNNDELFWSNKFGWVDYYSADSFSENEMKTLNLPIDGSWIKLS
jgi:hypothetical protein